MMRPRMDLISEVDALQYLPSSLLGAAVIYLGNHKSCWIDKSDNCENIDSLACQIFLGISGGVTDFFWGIRKTQTYTNTHTNTCSGWTLKELIGASPT